MAILFKRESQPTLKGISQILEIQNIFQNKLTVYTLMV